MSRNSLTRPPTPFNRRGGSGFEANRALSPSRNSISSRHSTTSAISSLTDEISLRSSSPSPSEWVVPQPLPMANQPSPPSPNAGYGILPPVFPSYPAPGHYPSTPWPTPYPSPPLLDYGFVSSRPTSSPVLTRTGTRTHSDRDGYRARTLDTVLCQVCLRPDTVCTCQCGDTDRMRMREAALEVFNRAEGATYSRATQHGEVSEPVAPAAGGLGYGCGYGHGHGLGYPPKYGGPALYAGSAVPVSLEQRVWSGADTASGYYSSPGLVPTSQTGDDEHRAATSSSVWEVRGE